MSIEEGKKINLKREDGTHAAFLAARGGYLDPLKLLIQKDPSVADLNGFNGITPLGAASSNGHLMTVKYLISLPHINIDSQDDLGVTPLIWATFDGHLHVVEYLLQNHANKSIKDNFGNTAMDYAAAKNNTELINLLKQEMDANFI